MLSHHTPAHDDATLHQVWLQMAEQFNFMELSSEQAQTNRQTTDGHCDSSTPPLLQGV